MNEKLIFIEILFKDVLKNFKIHIDQEEIYEKEMKKYIKGEVSHFPSDSNFMNKNHGKYVLKRKITLLRQELLNLERMLDE